MKMILTILIITFFSVQGVAQLSEEPNSEIQRENVFKIEIFSPLTGNLTIGFESFIKNTTSFETKIGFIGIGLESRDSGHQRGLFIKAGPKFMLKPNLNFDGIKSQYLLRGIYLRPIFILSIFKFPEGYPPYSNSIDDSSFNSIAIILNVGQQFILGKFIALDFNIGAGYGYVNQGYYYYSHVVWGDGLPIAFSAGLSIGFLIK
jgi:hypothetical protein